MQHPMVYKINEIQKKLKISRSTIYRFVESVYKSQKPFTVLKIGTQYRIVKTSFDSWIDGDVYEISEVQKILQISASSAYDFINDTYITQNPFRVIKILNQYRVSKKSFDLWITGEYETGIQNNY